MDKEKKEKNKMDKEKKEKILKIVAYGPIILAILGLLAAMFFAMYENAKADTTEYWVFKQHPSTAGAATIETNIFTTDYNRNQKFNAIRKSGRDMYGSLSFRELDGTFITVYEDNVWEDLRYRNIYFNSNASGDELLNYLKLNAIKIVSNTWKFNEILEFNYSPNTEINFTSYNNYDFIRFVAEPAFNVVIYENSQFDDAEVYVNNNWISKDYRTVTFSETPSMSLMYFLVDNAENIDPNNPPPITNLKPGKLNTLNQITMQQPTGFTNEWAKYEWLMPDFNAMDVWTDGTDYYLSLGTNKQFRLNKLTQQWERMEWGDFNIVGRYVWSDGSGTKLYYNNGTTAYIYDISTKTWSLVHTWSNPLDNQDRLYGNYFFSYENEIFYWAPNTKLCDVNVENTTLTITSNQGNFVNRDGADYIWSDGTNVYYNDMEFSYRLKIENGIFWEDVVWLLEGRIPTMNAQNIAKIENDYYIYLADNRIHKLLPSTLEISNEDVFTGEINNISGEKQFLSRYIWSNENSIYYSYYSYGIVDPGAIGIDVPEGYRLQLQLLKQDTANTQIYLEYTNNYGDYVNNLATLTGTGLTWADIKDIVESNIDNYPRLILQNYCVKNPDGTYTDITDKTPITNLMTITAKYTAYPIDLRQLTEDNIADVFDAGYEEGLTDGKTIGYQQGYNAGYLDGQNAGGSTILDGPKNIFNSVLEIINIPLFGITGFTVGTILAIVVTLGVVLFILKVVRG